MSILKSKSRLRYPHARRRPFPTRDPAVVLLCSRHWAVLELEGSIISRLEVLGHSFGARKSLLDERPAGHARHHPAEARRRLSVSLVPVTSATACYIVLYRLVRNHNYLRLLTAHSDVCACLCPLGGPLTALTDAEIHSF